MYFFLFNGTTLQVFVTYLTGALYVHPLWFYKHQHDNRVRSTQNTFSLPFAAILVNCAPSGEMHNYCTPHIIKENFENFLIHRCNYIYCYLKCILYDKLLKSRKSFWITLYINTRGMAHLMWLLCICSELYLAWIFLTFCTFLVNVKG